MPMMREVRQDRLLDHLRARGIASVGDLVEALDSSPATIRRDLDQLAATGVIDRTWGGARLASVEDDPFYEALLDHADAKAALARRAAELVRDGDTVVLDIGTTTHYLAQLLRPRELTVITASLPAFEVLRDAPGVRVVLLGGDYSPGYQCLEGTLTCEGIAHHSADVAFVGCSGVNGRGQVRDTSDAQVRVKRAIADACGRLVLLADASKFPGQGSVAAFSLDRVDTLVTDAPPSAALAECCARHDTEVLHP